MFKRIIRTILVSFALLTPIVSEATHIVGGELYYTYLGNNNYEIRLTVYRDCFYGVPPFDEPAYVGVWDANNNLVNTLYLYTNGDSSTVPPIINSPCFIPPTNVCYRVANYRTTVNLPPIAGGYQLTYQRCCRNQTILNIVSPLSTGATLYATIPGTPIQNSNPVFNSLPPPFICSGLAFDFDHSATDADGDSLVYEICTPFDGASQQNPQPLPQAFPPPYNQVFYQSPFNLGNLLGGTPLSIDAQTGQLTATPNTIGQFVIGICVNEYRNGVLLSRSRRDYQLNVVACPSLVVAAVQTPLLTCGSNTVQFTNNSFGASTYLWDFGDPTTTLDISNAINPSYTYPDTGTYNVTLIAYSAFNPGCADTTTGSVTLLPDYIVDFNYLTNFCSYSVLFNDTSNTSSGSTTQWLWNFGDGSPPSNNPDPSHVFPGPGTYNVTLTATSSLGCRETLSKTITLPAQVSVTTSSQSVNCNGDCDGIALAIANNGTPPYTFVWNDPNNQVTPTATGLCSGNYQVQVTDALGCTTTQNVTVGTPDLLNVSGSSTNDYCNGLCIGSTSINISGGVAPYTISWNDPNNQSSITATNLCQGYYSALITDVNGCSIESDSIEVQLSTFIPEVLATISDDTIYLGQSVLLGATTNAFGTVSYSWVPTTGLSNPNISNPTATPTETITYIVTMTDSNGCSNLDSVTVVVKEVVCEEPEIFIPSAFTPNEDNNNDWVFVRGNTIRNLLFRIYNRWGELVFESNDPSNGWDGKYNGKLATPAVYVYYVEAICFDNQRFFKKGNISLIR
ncbi:MAG: PKD domain-containing protein [Bacteroidota bacterium]|jgi:gliding motility-associated-like protein